MNISSDVVEEILDQYEEVLSKVGLKYVGLAHFNEG